MTMTHEEQAKIRKKVAKLAVKASLKTGDILPRRIYELAGFPAAEHAPGDLQQKNI